MEEINTFIRDLKKQVLNIVLIQFTVIIGAALTFYFTTQDFKEDQVKLNTEQAEFNKQIRNKVEGKVSIQMMVELQREYNIRQVSIDQKLDKVIFSKLTP